MRFDFIAARQEGYSYDEIADFLAKENGFDLAAARAEGYKTSEILEFLSEPPLRRLPAAEAPAAGGDPQFPDPYGAEPAKRTSSVLEGVFMPEPKFDPAEGERLSRRAANEPQQPRRQLPGAEMRQGREVEPRSAARAVADTALGLGQGAVGMVKGVADNIDAGDNAVSRTLEQAVQGLEYFKSDALRDQAIRRDALISTVQKNQGEIAAARAALNSIGLFPAATGDVAARGAGSLLPTVGMGVAGLGPASMWATNALANAGDAASQTADALRRLPPSEWQNDERYLSLLKDGQTHEQAVATLAPIYALPAQALGALTGFLSGRTGLERVIAGRGVGSGMRARVGAAGAEALGEQAETLIPQATGNLAVGAVDQQTDLTEGLGRAAVDTAIGSAPGAAIAAAAPVRNEQPVTAPIAAIAPAQTTDEAIIAAARALDAQPAEQAVANIERILGEANVSTPPAVPGSDTAATGGGMDLAAPGVAAGVVNDGGAVPAVDARGPAAELPAADLPQPPGPDLDALRGENAALRSQALQALEAQQVPAAPADALPAARGDEPAAQLPAAGSAPVEAGGVAPAATPAVEVTRRNNGTVVLKGDTQQILAALATQGLTGIPGNAGVIVAKSQAQQAATLFQQPEAAPNPVDQRAEFQAAEAKRQARASRLRAGAFDKNPIMAFLGKHGISLQLASEFAPGTTERRKAIVPGYGPVFRRNGMNLDLLAERAAEEGFLPPGSRDDRALYDLISRAMRGERVTPQYAQGVVEQEMETANRARFEDYLQADPLLPDDIEDAIQDVTSDPALEAELRALLAAAADEGIDTEAVLEKAVQIAENGNQDEYTRQAIADVTAARASRGDAAARARAEQGRPAAQRAGREAGQPDPGPEGDQQVLTAPTRADVEAQQDRAATAEALDQREQVRKESEAGAGLFSLTQEDGRQDTTGDLFGTPTAETDRAQESVDDLRKQLRDLEDRMVGAAGLAPGFIEEAVRSRKVSADMKARREELRQRIRDLQGKVDAARAAPTSKEIDAKTDQIMRLFDEMGGGIALTKDQVRALIVEKGMAAADKSVQAFREKIQQDKATQEKLAKLKPAAEKPVSQMSAADLLRAAADKMEAKPGKIDDLGEKIGGARKDTAQPTGRAPRRGEKTDDRPAWARRFQISQIVRAGGQIGEVRNEGRWVIRDTRSLDWMKQPKQVGRETFASREAAEKALPLLAVSMKHRVVPSTGSDGGQAWEIWRDVSDRKRVKVVDQQFASRDDAMRYMAENAEAIIEANTTFGEADLPVPDDKRREGPQRRQGDVKGQDFMQAFGFRGVEFGNWNNQDERQELMNEAYDGLMDLADVMGIPPKAISLNGDLALAFGARGHGLSGARAHYEPDRAVMNLTKMKGAGALAHEWFHALDHYFGRQDGKAPVQWVTNKDGTRSLKVNGDFENNAVSSGFSRTNSGVREEVRAAVAKVMTTMARKAEQYVEDTAKTERFVAAVRNDVDKQLASIRRDLAEQKDVRYYKRNNKPATADQLAEFDAIAQRILAGEALDTELRSSGTKSLSGMRWTNDALEQISAIYKAVRGRSGFDTTNQSGILDRLRSYMGLYSQRLKMLAEAQTGAEKTKQVPTDFAMDARSLDQGRGTDYWTTPHEMAARAFQGYVEDKIAERGGKSPFLNYGPENVGILTPWGAKRPYPAGEERKAINAAFDELVKVIKTRETDQGVAMYARGGQDQTDTPAFKKWFGDSKVVDDQGKPMVVYHGAGDSIHSFVDTKGRGAYYFTPNAEFASGFAFDAADSINENDGYDGEYYSQMESAGANTMPVYLSAQNPFDPRNQKHVDALIDEAGLGKNDAVRDIWRRRFSAGMYDDLEPYYQDMQALGFDGFYEKENGDQSFWNIGVFRPEQIKSATGNRGTFDPSDPDITMARGVMDAAAFRRAFGAPEPMGVDRTQQIVDELTRTWENGPAFEIVATAAGMPGGRHPSDARGLILNGTAYIVAANNPTRDAVARTLGHEAIGHYGLWKMLGEDGTRQFRRNVQLAIKAGNKPITAIRDKVRELYVDERGRFNLTPEQEADEIAAFAVEEGIDPVTGEFRPGFGFLKSVWAKIAAFLRDTLGLPVRFTNTELQGLLVQSMRGLQVGQRLEGGADMMVAAARDVSPEGKALQALSENDDLFALPKSDKTTVEEIAAEQNPRIKVRKTKIGSETLYTLTMPSGDDAKLWVRPANPYGDQIYSMDLVDGDTSNVETGRPGENPEDVDPATEDVYLDVSNLKEGGHGNELYNIAATFAHNTGRIFIGDPSGLSDSAMRRRLENMISTALKFGTTDHIAPHPRQVKGDAKIGVPPLKWVYGDSLGNIRRMIDISLKAEETGDLPKYVYDPATGNLSPAETGGRPLAEKPGPAGWGVSDVSGAPAQRGRTGARAAIFRALLREAGSGAQGDARGRDGLLARLVSVGNQFPGAVKGIFYARGPAGAGQPSVTSSTGTPPATRQTNALQRGLGYTSVDAGGRAQFTPGAWINDKIGDLAGPMLAKLGLKAASPELRRMLRQMKLEVEQAKETAAAVAGEATKLSDAERAMVSDLVEKELKAGTIPPAHAVRLAAVINDAMGKQTDELIRLGMLTRETAEKWRGQYLPRYYESKLGKSIKDVWADSIGKMFRTPGAMKGIRGKHLKGRGLYQTIPESQLADFEALGWEVRDPDYQAGLTGDGTVQVWRDFTRQERDAMGEIRDAGFRFVMGYMQTQKDIALGRLFEALASNPEMSSRTETEKFSAQVPETKVSGTGALVYGKLAGRWVSPETLSQLSRAEEEGNEALRVYRKAMSLWKESKTVLNPVAHANNIISNVTMAHFAGVSYWRPDVYMGAIRDLVRKDPMVKEAKEAGLFLGTMSDAELMQNMPEELKLLAQKQEGTAQKVGRNVWDLMSFWLRKPMGAAYQAEDTFFRYLLYRDARRRGIDPQDAVDYAQKYIFTYDDLPKGARMIRDFGLPFFAYTYKAVPALLNTALAHPERMAAPAVVLMAANTMAYAIAAGDDEEDWATVLRRYLNDAEFREKVREKEKFERSLLPEWNKGYTALMTPKVIRLGNDELTGLPLFLDMSRMMPGGDLFDVNPNAGGIPLPQPITPSHPLITLTIGLLANKDLFRGTDLTDSNDTSAEKAEKRADWIWKQLSPAIAVNNYHWERTMNALAQATGGEVKYVPDILGGDATGRGKDGEPVQPKYAAMQTFGIKVRPIDLEKSELYQLFDQKKMIQSIDAEIRKLKRQSAIGSIHDRAFEKELDAAIEKKMRLREGLTVDGEERD